MRDQEGGPDVCADDGGLQPHATAQPGANPPAGADVRGKGRENGLGEATKANQEHSVSGSGKLAQETREGRGRLSWARGVFQQPVIG